MEEARAQVFFRQKIMERSNATIRIPEVYHAFEVGGEKGRGYTYIVMEHIEIDFERTASDEQRAQAISELISVPPPPGVFGSLTGGMYRHHFFQDSEPPVPFASAAELEDYLNRCLELYKDVLGRQDTLDFSTEPLLCYYADVHPSNFPIDKYGQLWVIDFAQAGVLPSSFMSYAIAAHPKKRLPVRIRKTIPLPKSSNLGPLGRATYVLKTSHIDFDIPRDNRTEADADSASAS
ncbi:hypothetical protein CNMCM5793_003607 [Aspergillus hiratsukae]|uniref:Aminoglycoside phosphotransferase domain-containing protein n=1 Tax=Aspergillus hiratsukae TaxID=1194566 RepID=A0A8H6UC16_9EURO|nr:hypothetical protein CNMCM5793_003607 [Aspergillus hiratsukae]KAF7166480.1 hypothetical protein CNMCM6106_002291 [Aspergillus hiratsukae]